MEKLRARVAKYQEKLRAPPPAPPAPPPPPAPQLELQHCGMFAGGASPPRPPNPPVPNRKLAPTAVDTRLEDMPDRLFWLLFVAAASSASAMAPAWGRQQEPVRLPASKISHAPLTADVACAGLCQQCSAHDPPHGSRRGRSRMGATGRAQLSARSPALAIGAGGASTTRLRGTTRIPPAGQPRRVHGLHVCSARARPVRLPVPMRDARVCVCRLSSVDGGKHRMAYAHMLFWCVGCMRV